MKHLALLAAVYALIAALVLPSSLFASEESDPAVADTPAAESTPGEEAPAPADPAEPVSAPPEPAPAPEQPAPAPEPPAATPDEPAAPPAALDKPAREHKDKTAKASASGAVTIADFQFTPAQITIDQGDTVTWTNDGPTAHSATAPDGSFDTGIMSAGQSGSHTFAEAGTYSYICTPHPDMHGTVVVRASQTGGDTPDSNTGDSGGSGDTGGSGTSGAEAAQSDGGPALPSTGADAGALLILGALMLLLGIAVHRRVRAQEPRPAGRSGW